MFTVRIHQWPLVEVLGEIDQALAAELRALPVDVATRASTTGVTSWPPISMGEGEAVDGPRPVPADCS